MVDFIISRLREPSTYAGIAGVIGGLAFIPNAGSIAATVVAVGTAVAGILAIWLPEKKA